MRKITLLLSFAMLFMANGVWATTVSQTVAYLGNFAFSGTWGNNSASDANVSIPATAFSGVKEGNMLIVKGTGTIEMHDGNNWNNKIEIAMIETGTKLTLTAAQAGYLANGSTIQSTTDGAVLKEISFGDVVYTDTELLTSEQTQVSWTKETISNFAIGDELIFVFKATDSSKNFKFAIQKTDESNWPAIEEANWKTYNATEESQTETIAVTEEMRTHTLQVGGENITFTSIVKRQYNDITYTYKFSEGSTNIDVTSLSGIGTFDLSRSFDNYWNTLCLPFNCPTSLFNASAKFYTFKEYDPNKGLVFTERTPTELNAGVPYLVNLYGSGQSTLVAENVTFSTSITPSTTGSFTYTGNYTVGLNMEGKYGLAWTSDDNETKFRKGGSGTTLNAFRAYFSSIDESIFNSGDGARSLGIAFENETTGLQRMATEQEAQAIYSLMGVQTKHPTKGLYIINGKKVIVK